ncbi:FHA domain-containing protein [Nostoc sp. C117]|uniref:FHA domain-containing protein n=1 Tax=Nostoc sp. C117 TaxID=3349875 RepID=UPI00370D7127
MKVKVSYSPTVSEINEVDLTIESTTRGEWLVGRSPDSDLVLDSPDVSRLHAKFFVKSGSYYFLDLGSRNGSIFNGKQAEKDRPYILNDGDVIRIADYVLILEAVVSEQLPETVFRIIDPSLFSRSRSPENISTSNVANPAPEVVSEVITPISKEVETPEINAVSPEISEISEVASNQPDDAIPVAELTTSENIIQPSEAVSEVPRDARDEIVDLRTLVEQEEISPEVTDIEVPEVSETEPDEAVTTPENIIPTPEEETTPPAATDDEVADFATALATESTFVQRRDIESAIPQATSDEDAELEAALEAEVTYVQPRDIMHDSVPPATYDSDAELQEALEAEVTFVQPRDIFNQVSQESDAPAVTDYEAVNLDTPVVEQGSGHVDGVVSDVTPETSKIHQEVDIQHQDISTEVPHEVSDELVNLDTLVTTEDTADVHEVEPNETISEVPHEVSDELVNLDTLVTTEDTADVREVESDETISEVSEALTSPDDDNIPEVSSNQYIDLMETSTEEVSADVDGVSAQVSELSDLDDIQSLQPTETETPEITSQTVEEVSEVEATESDEISSELETTESDEISEEINLSEPPEMIVDRNIVIIAHESKKSELAEFVGQHQEFFSQSFTITWPSVSEILHQQVGITVSQQTPAPTSGGYQTIASLVGSGEILAVIFLRDLLQPQPGQANEEALLRLCNINQVLLATNVPTAEAIVHYLKHIVD